MPARDANKRKQDEKKDEAHLKQKVMVMDDHVGYLFDLS